MEEEEKASVKTSQIYVFVIKSPSIRIGTIRKSYSPLIFEGDKFLSQESWNILRRLHAVSGVQVSSRTFILSTL